MKQFKQNNLTYNYIDTNEVGFPVFLFHGNSAGKEVFKRQYHAHELTNLRLIAPDLPGCGDNSHSKNPDLDYSLKAHLEFISSFIDHFKFEKYVIVAHSLSGHLVLECADALKGLVGLILFGTPPLGTNSTNETPFLPNEAMALLFKKELSKTEIQTLSQNLCGNFLPESQLITTLLLKSDGAIRESFANALGKGEFKDEVEIFRSLEIPKMIIHAENDSMINGKYLQQFSNELFDKRINIVNNVSHYLQLENPETFNSLLATFVKQII